MPASAVCAGVVVGLGWCGGFDGAWGLKQVDKYGSKHTGSQTNIQAKIGGTYEEIRTDGVYIREGTVGVYIREGKDMRRQTYEDSTFE